MCIRDRPPAVCNCTEKCKAGEVNTACPVCSVNMDSCTGKEATPEEPAEQEQPQNGMGGLLIFLVVGLLGGGAALYYFKFMKPKQSVKGSTDLDEFDFDEYGSYGYDWRKGFEYSNANEYVDDIKSVAQYYGYDSDEIDCLLNNGFTPEEVEEMLYADDFLEV